MPRTMGPGQGLNRIKLTRARSDMEIKAISDVDSSWPKTQSGSLSSGVRFGKGDSNSLVAGSDALFSAESAPKRQAFVWCRLRHRTNSFSQVEHSLFGHRELRPCLIQQRTATAYHQCASEISQRVTLQLSRPGPLLSQRSSRPSRQYPRQNQELRQHHHRPWLA
ncbi:hypothetical protein MAPG_03056 [Magnaporthiopsis poae ATCC 64411]|uniref:Uncharacterized protein n=1 Tax=Magnaporthiopsis poae (strain ATCC 64411 / 73-15) TaxID=644358 RepID=A0A0C4DT08_MAGP6|nr:hypothetical protein MAPG_03056 [Magnaporthiopsis poae ATCC 64411]